MSGDGGSGSAPAPPPGLVGAVGGPVAVVAAARLAVGGACLVAPALSRLWLGPAAGGPAARVLSRSLAARDIVLAWGALSATGAARSRWARAGIACDAADAVGTLLAGRSAPRGRRVAVGLVSAAAAITVALATTGGPRP
jgi:hypothetical protein